MTGSPPPLPPSGVPELDDEGISEPPGVALEDAVAACDFVFPAAAIAETGMTLFGPALLPDPPDPPELDPDEELELDELEDGLELDELEFPLPELLPEPEDDDELDGGPFELDDDELEEEPDVDGLVDDEPFVSVRRLSG